MNLINLKVLNCSTSQVSAEGAEFWVDRRCATVSRVIKTMLEGNFTESRGEVTFADIRAPILEKVRHRAYCSLYLTPKKKRIHHSECVTTQLLPFSPVHDGLQVVKYMYYNVKYTSTSSMAPDFPVELDMAVELLKISHFLEC